MNYPLKNYLVTQRFGERTRHQIFLEPEGLSSELVYPNGISTSMPKDMQDVQEKQKNLREKQEQLRTLLKQYEMELQI